MEKIGDIPVGRFRGAVVPPGTRTSRQQALMKARITEHGAVLVDCPYCLVYSRVQNPVDVTRFVDAGGKKEHSTSCSKGHTLRFKQIDEWRERRQKMGIQSR